MQPSSTFLLSDDNLPPSGETVLNDLWGRPWTRSTRIETAEEGHLYYGSRVDARRILKSALSAGLPFGLFFGAFLSLKHGDVAGGMLGGFLAGTLFGSIVGVFTEVQRKKLMVQGDRYEGELILHQGPANHWRGAESRGGWLILTSGRLAFRSHGKNIQNAPLDLPLSQLRGAEAYRSFGIVPNGLRVLGTSEERFVVTDRSLWVERIRAALAESKSS